MLKLINVVLYHNKHFNKVRYRHTHNVYVDIHIIFNAALKTRLSRTNEEGK